MKKRISLLFIVIMILSMSSICFAESTTVNTPTVFDYEKLKKITSVYEDDIEGRAFVYYDGGNYYEPPIANSGNGCGFSSNIYSDIIVLNLGTENEIPIQRIWINYYDKEWLFIDECIIKVGDNRYNFSGIDNSRDNGYTEFFGTWVKESLLILLGEKSVPFMEDLCKASDSGEKVILRVKGSKGYSDLDITGNIAKIAGLYERLKSCGGTLPRYTTLFNENIQ